MKRTRIDQFKIKREMQRRGIATLQDLALLAGISSNTLYSVADSYSWRAATLDAIANALGVESPLVLLTVDDVTESPKRQTANSHTTQRQTMSDFTGLASEEVLAREWLTPEEDEAWADL
jgi:lambda repressor-like predicted transcriptional regulator